MRPDSPSFDKSPSGVEDPKAATAMDDPQPTDPVYDSEGIWSDIKKLKSAAESVRRPLERVWELAWDYYEGRQWRKWIGNDLVAVADDGKPQLVANRVAVNIDTKAAHLLKNRPIGVVMPETEDEEDRNAARTANKVVEYYEHALDMPSLKDDITLWMLIAGNAFVKTWWDPEAGRKIDKPKIIIDPDTGEPARGPSTTLTHPETGETVSVPGDMLPPTMVKEPVGSPRAEFCSPLELYPDPAATRMANCQRILHVTLKPISEIQEKYGDKASELKPIDPLTHDTSYKYKQQFTRVSGGAEVSQMVEVTEAWFRPSKKYPKGLYAVYANEKFMTAGPTPPGYDQIPFTHCQEKPTRSFWGIAAVHLVLDLQRSLNVNVSMEEFNRMVQRPKAIAPFEANIDDEDWDNQDSEIVRYAYPYRPDYIGPPSLPPHHIDLRNFLEKTIDDVAGGGAILRGQDAGAEVRSGRMVAYMQETATTVLGRTSRIFEQSLERMWNLILDLVKENLKAPELASIVGKNRAIEIFSFTGESLRGAGRYVVQAGSSLPMGRAERQDFIMELCDRQILQDRGMAMKMLDLPSDLDSLIDEDQLDRDNAVEENQTFQQLNPQIIVQAHVKADQDAMRRAVSYGQQPVPGGQPPMATPTDILTALKLAPRDFEWHDVHLEHHNKFRKSRAYRQLPPETAALFDEHCDVHKNYLQPAAPPPGANGPGGARGARGAPAPQLPGGPGGMLAGGNSIMPAGGAGVTESGPEAANGLPPVPSVPGPNTPGGR